MVRIICKHNDISIIPNEYIGYFEFINEQVNLLKINTIAVHHLSKGDIDCVYLCLLSILEGEPHRLCPNSLSNLLVTADYMICN